MSEPFVNCLILGFIAFMLAVNVAVIVVGVIVLTVRELRRVTRSRQPPGFYVIQRPGPRK